MPAYPANPATDAERDVAKRYSKVLGSAVNPVLREGNSDRRVAAPVKENARKNPHALAPWPVASKSRVVSMRAGDFYGSEKSAVMARDCTVRIEHCNERGEVTVLKEALKLEAGEIVDASFMSLRALGAFYSNAFAEARAEGVLASLHLKATMMKVSDPIMFGAAVRAYYAPVFAKHSALFRELRLNPANGWKECLEKLATLPLPVREGVLADVAAAAAAQAPLAFVDTRKGTSNLHVPSDVIVDASMPCVVRDGGKMWNERGALQDTHAIIPDRCYGGIFEAMLRDVRAHGQFDVTTMGSTSNVGLMARKAEEYGSHDKTFQAKEAGVVSVVEVGAGGARARVVFQHAVEEGDIWRMCQTKDAPVRDWVGLAVSRARASGAPAFFWLDPARPHDAHLAAKVAAYLPAHDTKGLDIRVLAPEAAMAATCARVRAGQDTISVTGNVLRDYLTDLFPILELGTSSKMQSVVPMMAGGGMYETGAGGTAPKLLQMFFEDNHMRWDSLGEYLALAVSLEDLAAKAGNARAGVLASALSAAIGRVLDEQKSPAPAPGPDALDNRGTGVYLALYWAQAMAERDPAFRALADALAAGREASLRELRAFASSNKVDMGGYWVLDAAKANRTMRPSATFNAIIDKA